MRSHALITNQQFDKIAGFLDEHPRFAPMLDDPEALIVGFQIGACCLTLREMVKLADTAPRFDVVTSAMLLLPSPATPTRTSE